MTVATPEKSASIPIRVAVSRSKRFPVLRAMACATARHSRAASTLSAWRCLYRTRNGRPLCPHDPLAHSPAPCATSTASPNSRRRSYSPCFGHRTLGPVLPIRRLGRSQRPGKTLTPGWLRLRKSLQAPSPAECPGRARSKDIPSTARLRTHR
jgi:hypothetical protein